MMTPNEKFLKYQERVENGGTIDFLSGSQYCFSCCCNVYEYVSEGVIKNGTITGCPICHRTFCD